MGAAKQNNQTQYSTAIELAINRKIIAASQMLSAERDIRSIAAASVFSTTALQMIFAGREFAGGRDKDSRDHGRKECRTNQPRSRGFPRQRQVGQPFDGW
jgi:hypothetical protein